MQANTKRLFMELLSIALIFFAIILNIILNSLLLMKLLKINEITEKILYKYPGMFEYLSRHQINLNDKVNELIEDQKNSFLELKTFFCEPVSPKSPIRPNKWDNIKEAFKGPTKVEVDE